MLSVLNLEAAGDLAAASSSSAGLQPWFVFIIIAVVLLSSFVRAASRKRRTRDAGQYAPASPTGKPGVAHQATPVPYAGTLLNGVPMKNYDSAHGHQTGGFANERMRAEAELKRQLDALDTARRIGQVTAEQYAVHRDAIFKAF
ncbi:hypothetical protein [Arthrobacter sp. GMC3]|uniref:hypothetical protein n=1 Tax=Arthrobacter sp. GMC3 TaxID=2058894 RepID=UPI000CE45F44|nr:hypothetical protein [Arthrobacter sp. GMC3]